MAKKGRKLKITIKHMPISQDVLDILVEELSKHIPSSTIKDIIKNADVHYRDSFGSANPSRSVEALPLRKPGATKSKKKKDMTTVTV